MSTKRASVHISRWRRRKVKMVRMFRKGYHFADLAFSAVVCAVVLTAILIGGLPLFFRGGRSRRQ